MFWFRFSLLMRLIQSRITLGYNVFIKKEKKDLMKSHLFPDEISIGEVYILFVVCTALTPDFTAPLAKISSVTEKETMSRKNPRVQKSIIILENYSAYVKRYP